MVNFREITSLASTFHTWTINLLAVSRKPTFIAQWDSPLPTNLISDLSGQKTGLLIRSRSAQAPLYAGFLSSGTQTTFLWIRWLAYKMLYHYDFAEGWQNKPVILLIDEIENHLHPTWQRRVIPALLKHFPGLQIFATTHSPFVVAGLRAGQVHLLDRNSEGVVTATTTEQDIIGWTTDEILRSFMGVAEPTDELTIQRTKRLRELRRKESRTDEEAEELETLRRQVNADLLSSRSPMEQQHERYADMMLRFIESRQAQLSQDS